MQPDDVTPLFQRIGQGDPSAAEHLLPLVYDELRRLAAARMAREAPGQTLQATALVHEAWLRLGGDRQPAWANRGAAGGQVALLPNFRERQGVRLLYSRTSESAHVVRLWMLIFRASS